MAVTLGFSPIQLTVTLALGGEFLAALVNDAGDWALGTGIELRFENPGTAAAFTWPAVIDGSEAKWDRPAADVAAVVGANARQVRMHYTSPTGDVIVWGRGRTNVV